jgi:HEAT repeat protein
MLRRAITIDENDEQSRLLLAEVLAGTGDRSGAIEILVQFLEKNPTHRAARFLLGQTYFRARQMERARDEFKALLFHDKENVAARKALALCYMALRDLERAEPELEKLLAARPKDQEARLMLVDVLLGLGRIEDARARLKEALEGELPPEVEKRVREKIADLEKPGAGTPAARTLDDLAKKLESEDPRVRREVMRRLATLKFSRVPRVIMKHIVDEDVGVRVLVARIVGETGDPGSVPVLALKLRHPRDRDESKLVRGACAEALGRIPSPASVPVLLTVLGDEEPYVVELALRALRARCGVRFSEGDAAAAVEKDAEAVRQAWWRWWRSDRAVAWKFKAVVAIAKLGSKAMVTFLVPLMEDADADVFTAAYAAFTELTGQSFGEVKDDPKDRARVAKAAREWWKAGGR